MNDPISVLVNMVGCWLLLLICAPFVVYYASKIASLGWHKGKLFFEQRYLEKKDE